MNFTGRKYFPYVILFSIVFVSRLPFLAAGYGVEEDSWGIALAGFHTKITGIYEPSRFPGHPVHEFIYSAFWGYSPFVYNLFAAFFSAIAAVFFALILKELQFKYFFIAALAFAFTPVYYISSTYTIDFVWTIAFVLISFYSALKNKYVVCGVFLGLAIGCRITSGAMLLPLLIVCWQKNDISENAKRLFKIILPLLLTVLLSYLPLIREFGLSFFMYYDQFPYPSLAKVFYKMIPGVFGFVGMAAIAVSLVWIIFNRKRSPKGVLFEKKPENKILIACYAVIILFVVSYFRLPQKSGYMITVIPFLILLFGYYLNEKWFKLFCFSLMISSFVCSINLTDKLRGASFSKYAFTLTVSGQELFFDPFSGPVFSDYSKRLQKIKYTNDVILQADSITVKTIIIAGWWYNQIMVTLIPKKTNDLVVYEPYINSGKLDEYVSQGYVINYLAEQNVYNDQMFKMDYTDKVASPF
jgi:hypothetical protein